MKTERFAGELKESPELWDSEDIAAAYLSPTLNHSVAQAADFQRDGQDLTINEQQIQINPIQDHNLHIFKELNTKLLPVTYNEIFYRDIVLKHSPKYCVMGIIVLIIAFCNGEAIAAISCRKEVALGVHRLYIMTLGVLPAYRRKGLGKFRLTASFLLRNILDSCLDEVDIEEVCLHVCVSNQKALNLYKSNGFSIDMVLRGYYELNAGVLPPDAYLLKKAIPNNVLKNRIKQL